MAKKEKEVQPVKIFTQEERVELLDEEIKGHDATVTEFETQLKALNVDLQDENRIINEKVEKELDAFPESSPKGLLEKIFKMPQLPKRGQLQENINKITVGLEHTRGKRNKVIREKQKLVEAIKQKGLNTLTERLCEILEDTFSKYLDFENSFFNLKEKVSELGLLDRMFFNRIDNSKYPTVYNEIFGLSLMSPGSLPGLTANNFVVTAMNIGKDAENPLKPGRWARQEDKHISEQGFPGHEGFREPEAAATERLSEIFEEGPSIPTAYE